MKNMKNMKKEYSSPTFHAYGSIEQITRVGSIGMISGSGSWGERGDGDWDRDRNDYS